MICLVESFPSAKKMFGLMPSRRLRKEGVLIVADTKLASSSWASRNFPFWALSNTFQITCIADTCGAFSFARPHPENASYSRRSLVVGRIA